MRLLFISLLILNLFFGAWNLEKRLSSGGNLQHSAWFVICLAASVLCFLELRHQKKSSSSLGMPALGSLETFLEKVAPGKASSGGPDEEEGSRSQGEPESEDLKRAA